MVFRFVHTADIHLDPPLRSLAAKTPISPSLWATPAARHSLPQSIFVDHVDALVIAGDLYDGDQTSMKTARFLGSQMARLHQAGISVFKGRGNHDALSRISKQLVFPDTVTIAMLFTGFERQKQPFGLAGDCLRCRGGHDASADPDCPISMGPAIGNAVCSEVSGCNASHE